MSLIISAILADPVAGRGLIFAVTFFVAASIFYTEPVQRAVNALLRQARCYTEKLEQNTRSPYDRVFKSNRVAITMECVILYVLTSMLAVSSSAILLISACADVLWYKKLVGMVFGLAVMCLARILKVDGDKALYRLRHRMR